MPSTRPEDVPQYILRDSDSRSKWALAAFIAIGGFFLLAEHKAHVLGALPFLLLLACHLLHLFHHGGHGAGSHGAGNHERPGVNSSPKRDRPD